MSKLSIIIPMYNAEKSIKGIITAIRDNEICDEEIILIDDGSEDGTAKLCEELCEEDGAVKLIKCEHAGVSSARNRGLKEAKGKYIAFLDADDFIDKNYFSELTALMEEKDLDWVACGYREIWSRKVGKQKKKIVSVFDTETTLVAEENRGKIIDAVFCGPGKNNLFSVCMGIYKKKVLEDNNIVFEEGISYGEDTLFNYDVAHVVKCFGYTPKQLYIYVQDDASSMHSIFEKDILEKEMNLIKALENKRKQRGETWSDMGLRYLMMQLFTTFRHNILLISDKDERHRAYEEYLTEARKEPISHIIEKIKLRHAKGIGEKGFLYLLKGEHFEIIDILWEGIVKKMILNNEQDII